MPLSSIVVVLKFRLVLVKKICMLLSGVMHAEDGLRKLRQMENTTGIWTMRCLLIVERKNLIVIDKGNGVSML